MSGKSNIKPSSEEFKHRLEEKRLDAGWLGKLFGSTQSAPSNIAGIVLISLIAIGIYSVVDPPEEISTLEIWKVLAPIMTMTLGYIFGRHDP